MSVAEEAAATTAPPGPVVPDVNGESPPTGLAVTVLEQVGISIILVFLILVSVLAIAEIASRVSLSGRVDNAIAEITKNMAQGNQTTAKASPGPAVNSQAAPPPILVPQAEHETMAPPNLAAQTAAEPSSKAPAQSKAPPPAVPTPPSAATRSAQSAPQRYTAPPPVSPPPPTIIYENSLEKLSVLYLAKEMITEIESAGEQGTFTKASVETLLLSRFYRNMDDIPDLSGDMIPYIFHLFKDIGSDMILSIVVVFSGGIGAVISGIRKNQFSLFRDLSLGLAAGFISYLAIRGGKSVLLLEHAGKEFIMNPYGCAFFGLLAGLFTDRAYGILSDLFDALIKRFKTALQ